jgi:hypothetical protein
LAGEEAQVAPNLPHLEAALNQYGPWSGQNPPVTAQWVGARLQEKINTIDWNAAAADVERFLGPAERQSLKLWSARFFMSKAVQLFSAH